MHASLLVMWVCGWCGLAILVVWVVLFPGLVFVILAVVVCGWFSAWVFGFVVGICGWFGFALGGLVVLFVCAWLGVFLVYSLRRRGWFGVAGFTCVLVNCCCGGAVLGSVGAGGRGWLTPRFRVVCIDCAILCGVVLILVVGFQCSSGVFCWWVLVLFGGCL